MGREGGDVRHFVRITTAPANFVGAQMHALPYDSLHTCDFVYVVTHLRPCVSSQANRNYFNMCSTVYIVRYNRRNSVQDVYP